MPETIYVYDLGTINYHDAWNVQEQLFQQNVQAKINFYAQQKERLSQGNRALSPSQAATRHFLLLCEHPPVITLGKNGRSSHLLVTPEQLHKLGIDFIHTNRGGDITFHGPGQLVAYPILDLEKFFTDIGKYMRLLEQSVIDLLQEYDIQASRSPGETGVWLDPDIPHRARKICALGVRCSRWLTMHGLALNVNTDLHYFDYIIPCGIQGKQVSSMQRETAKIFSMEEVKTKWIKHFTKLLSQAIDDDVLVETLPSEQLVDHG
ncbi:MAG: lipoyl(octanoyl) transferase LipB [Thermoflavifilum sp.]|nr:lipoyl(octanoyl) transferase LipB [Thermoflavifilum sp.]